MKREEKILLAVFVAVLLGCLGAALSVGKRERAATVQFADATWATNGRFTLVYSATQSRGTRLREIVSIDGTKNVILVGQASESFLRRRGPKSGGGESSYLSERSTPGPSLLVKTGIIYTITLTNPLVVYDFTNSQGVHYKREFVLEPY